MLVITEPVNVVDAPIVRLMYPTAYQEKCWQPGGWKKIVYPFASNAINLGQNHGTKIHFRRINGFGKSMVKRESNSYCLFKASLWKN